MTASFKFKKVFIVYQYQKKQHYSCKFVERDKETESKKYS